MNYCFPQPKVVPNQVKDKVMKHIYSQKKGSLLKRGSLVKIFSGYTMFLGVVILFSWLYLHNGSKFDKTISNKIVTLNISEQTNILVSPKDVDMVEEVLAETEAILAEIDDLL